MEADNLINDFGEFLNIAEWLGAASKTSLPYVLEYEKYFR